MIRAVRTGGAGKLVEQLNTQIPLWQTLYLVYMERLEELLEIDIKYVYGNLLGGYVNEAIGEIGNDIRCQGWHNNQFSILNVRVFRVIYVPLELSVLFQRFLDYI